MVVVRPKSRPWVRSIRLHKEGKSREEGHGDEVVVTIRGRGPFGHPWVLLIADTTDKPSGNVEGTGP